jgi:probable F420-dependent oxidoreductase
MTFTLSVTLPFDRIQHGDEFGTMESVHTIAKAVEDAGFWSGTVTDHPVPSYRWLDSGGHYAQDPFVMMAMVATVTTKLRVQSNIIVLPYRNPFITARAISSLDVFSGGRVVVGVGAGYLKPEYKALGVDFDSRNDLMDEYMTAMKLAWTGENFTFEGTGYSAVGNRVLPTPLQKPHPPLLVGGNSKRALRRTVELGDAWNPFIQPKEVTDTARTVNISSDQDIVDSIAYMNEHCEKVGRAVPPAVVCSGTFSIQSGWNPQETLDHIGRLKAIGVSGAGAAIQTGSRAEYCELAAQFGEEVIAKIG